MSDNKLKKLCECQGFDLNQIASIISTTNCTTDSFDELNYKMEQLDEDFSLLESLVELSQLSIPSPIEQIAIIKSQLKHCKNPLQKLNLEREMNKLIRERRKCK